MQFNSSRGKRTLKLTMLETRKLKDALNMVEEIQPLLGRGHPLSQDCRSASVALFAINAALPDIDLNAKLPTTGIVDGERARDSQGGPIWTDAEEVEQ